ncbi:MAG: hypothetical protein E7496_10435 [Ruminococcus sp.]|nr:hypothetical protein [Ruminococcus sp.]
MTAKFLNNYPARNALRIISQNRKFAIVTSILYLLGIPLMMFAGMTEGYLSVLSSAEKISGYSFNCEPYVFIGGFCAAIAVFLGFFCGIRAFEDEWNKTRVDMLYSLPLNGTQRFFSNYAGGFLMYSVPYLVSVVIGWIILLIMLPMIQRLDTLPAEYTDEFKQFYLYYFLGTLGLFALMCLYYTISAVCASCCGTLFENIYTNLLLNALIPGTFAAVLAVITYNIEGLDFEYSWDFIGYMSPVGGLIYLAYLILDKGFDGYTANYDNTYCGYGGTPENQGIIPAFIRWIVCILLLTIVLTVLAWKLYQRRKAEHVGKPFVYSWIYYVILTAVTICILCISAVEDDFIIAVLLFSAIVYFVMEVIRKRGFKKFWLSVVTYIATVAVAFGGYILITVTDAFGRVSYIPALATVASAEITFSGYGSGRSTQYDLTYKDRETLSKIQDFQKNYLQNHDNLTEELKNLSQGYHSQLYYDYNSYDYSSISSDYYDNYNLFSTTVFTVTYHTITGTNIHRNYQLYHDEYLEIMQICASTDAFAEANARLLKNRLTSDVQEYNDKTHQYEIPANTSFEVNYFYNNDTESTQRLYLTDAENTITSLADIYQEDMQNLSFENLCTDEILGYIQSLPVYESCSGTVSFLKGLGFSEFNLLDALGSQYNTAYQNMLEIRIFAPENYCSGSLNYPSCLFSTQSEMYLKENSEVYQDIVMMSDSMTTAQYCPELAEVLSHARRHYISSEPCYLIYLNGYEFMIPQEYSGTVENMIKLGDNYYHNKLWGGYNSYANYSNSAGSDIYF